MDIAASLSLGRIALGATAYAAPELSLKAMALGDVHAGTPLFVRLFGIRDLAIGVATLLVEPQHRPALIGLGVVTDAGDAVAGLLALRSGTVRPVVAAAITGAAASAVLAGLVAIDRQRKA